MEEMTRVTPAGAGETEEGGADVEAREIDCDASLALRRRLCDQQRQIAELVRAAGRIFLWAAQPAPPRAACGAPWRGTAGRLRGATAHRCPVRHADGSDRRCARAEPGAARWRGHAGQGGTGAEGGGAGGVGGISPIRRTDPGTFSGTGVWDATYPGPHRSPSPPPPPTPSAVSFTRPARHASSPLNAACGVARKLPGTCAPI